LIKGVEGTILVMDYPDRSCVYVEEMGYIVLRILWAERVGNVAVSKVVTGKWQSLVLVHLVVVYLQLSRVKVIKGEDRYVSMMRTLCVCDVVLVGGGGEIVL
jgi:hypothetical protein